jgi:hypothetical protein
MPATMLRCFLTGEAVNEFKARSGPRRMLGTPSLGVFPRRFWRAAGILQIDGCEIGALERRERVLQARWSLPHRRAA